MYTPFCPVDVRVLSKREGMEAVRALWRDKPRRILVLAPRLLCASLSLAPFFTALQGDGHAVQLCTEIPANPSVEDLSAQLCELRAQGYEPTALLAVGGGSCIDLAKGVSALYHLPKDTTGTPDAVRRAIMDKAYLSEHPFVDIVAMPTTSGTGSEVTKWATIWDGENRRKLSIDCERCFCKAAVLIPDWTAGMPDSLTLSTGLDALCHAMEAFWARARTPLSQALAYTAIRKVRDFLPATLADPGSLTLRREMALASLLAGMAFSQTRTTACHSIGYPLTMMFGMPHGFASAVTLASVARRNAAAVPEMSALDAMFDGDLRGWLSRVSEPVRPLRLSAFGVTEGDLENVAALTFTAGRMDNNPIVFTREEVMEILRESL